MSPALNESSVIQCFEHNNAIEIRDGISTQDCHRYLCSWKFNNTVLQMWWCDLNTQFNKNKSHLTIFITNNNHLPTWLRIPKLSEWPEIILPLQSGT